MTLPALERNVQKAHTPTAETFVMEYVYDIKTWLEPCLNSIKIMFIPNSYNFYEKNGKVEMKYKAWASNERGLPEGTGLILLNGLVKPDTRKLLEVKQLQDCVKMQKTEY